MGATFFYKELLWASEMSPSRPTAGSPLFLMVGPLEGCVCCCFSGSQMPPFLIRSCLRLLRCLRPGLLQAVPVMVCCLQHLGGEGSSNSKSFCLAEQGEVTEPQADCLGVKTSDPRTRATCFFLTRLFYTQLNIPPN